MKKIVKGNKEFKVVPENRTVYGVMCDDTVFDEIKRAGIKEKYKHVLTSLLMKKDPFLFFKPDTISAKAVCDENDEYDESCGIDVCFSKLELKRHTRAIKKYQQLYDHLSKMMNIVDDLADRHWSKVVAISEDLARNYHGKDEK